MPVRLIVTFTTLSGRAEDFIRAWDTRLPEVHAEPGCEQYELFRSVERADTVVLLEQWSNADTFAEHGRANQARTPVGRDLLAERAVLEKFET